jgi:hypothetical protein
MQPTRPYDINIKKTMNYFFQVQTSSENLKEKNQMYPVMAIRNSANKDPEGDGMIFNALICRPRIAT